MDSDSEYSDAVVYGVVCEVNRNSVKLFNFSTQTMIDVPGRFEQDDIGKGLRAQESDIRRKYISKFGGNQDFFVVNGTVYAKTWAIRPDAEKLSDELFSKYSGRTWSPYFGYLNDSEQIFERKFRSGVRGCITIKYAPKNGFLFEIIGAHNRRVDDERPITNTPWDNEMNGEKQKELEPVHPSKMVIHDLSTRRILHTHSVCLDTNIRNQAYNPKYERSKKSCSILFNFKRGIFRTMRSVEIGKWYNHSMHDTRRACKKDTERIMPSCTFLALTATHLGRVSAPLKTRFDEERRKVEIHTKFIFNHDDLEAPSNRRISDWDVRENGIDDGAHFWDKHLGRVEIGQGVAGWLIRKIEDYRRNLDIMEREALEAEPIEISVRTRPFHNYIFHNSVDAIESEKYPNRGVFKVIWITKVKYQGDSGPPIYPKFYGN